LILATSSRINKRCAHGLELGSLMRKRWFVVALVGILFASVPAMAQGSGFGMGFKGGYIDIGGGDLSAVQGGFGLDERAPVFPVDVPAVSLGGRGPAGTQKK